MHIITMAALSITIDRTTKSCRIGTSSTEEELLDTNKMRIMRWIDPIRGKGNVQVQGGGGTTLAWQSKWMTCR